MIGLRTPFFRASPIMISYFRSDNIKMTKAQARIIKRLDRGLIKEVKVAPIKKDLK